MREGIIMLKSFYQKALANQELMVKLRRDFHSYPELGQEEIETSRKIKEFLQSIGVEHKEIAKTGVLGIIRGKGEKAVGLRADMDALPIKDKKQCSYSSKIEGKMHACGHDAHMAMLLGAAKILRDMEKELKGDVVMLFEPAEETIGGARLMIEEGALENPHVDAVFGLHVDASLDCGKVGLKSGVVNAASNPFKVKITGKGAHGAHPDDGIDTISIACNIISTLQTLISRETSPTEPAVLTVGAIHGGTAENIISDEVEFVGTIRTLSKEHREFIKKRFREVVEGVAISMRGNAEITIVDGYPCLYNSSSMFEILSGTAIGLIGSDNIVNLEKPSLGVESFAYFAMERPSAFYYIGCGNKDKGIVNPAHNSLFDIDEDCLAIGAAMQSALAYNFLNEK